MSKYTTEVRFICETAAGYTESKGFKSTGEIISKAAPKIFNFNFPIFDESYRLTLESKILRHYYTREISEETVGLWKLRLQDRLNTIMPYYNKLYKSELLDFNPLYDTNLTRDFTKTTDGQTKDSGKTDTTSKTETTTQNTTTITANTATDTDNTTTINSTISDKSKLKTETTDSKNQNITESKTQNKWDYYSDTPQGTISGVADTTYLTDLRNIKDNDSGTKATTETDTNNVTSDFTDTKTDKTTNALSGSVTEESTTASTLFGDVTFTGSGNETKTNTKKIDNTEDYIEHITGKSSGGSMSKMLLEFRETFLNIDKMILDELQDLFFGLW